MPQLCLLGMWLVGLLSDAVRCCCQWLQVCNEILDVLDKYLVPTARSAEAAVFYLKMKADYLRYLAEFKADGARKEAAELSLAA